MKLGIRIFLCNLLIFAVCFYYPFDWFVDTLRTRYLEGVEDPLADQANMLATLAEMQMTAGRFDPGEWYDAFNRIYARQVSAQIYGLEKKKVDVRVYITDAAGTVVFDSESRETIGQDYSHWRDVRRTLRGEYGARTTLKYDFDPTSSVLYVAAPIRVDKAIAGVLTVAKPTTNIKYFLKNARPKITGIALVAIMAAGMLTFLVSLWITRPIRRLTHYANAIRDGRQPPFPKLDRSEIGDMGQAFEEMQEALEGKQYVERYVQNLTHEIKSPLSAIRGAAELMAEPMEDDRRKRFLANIQTEALRIQQIVDRMLELAALENRKSLRKIETVSAASLVNTVMESMGPLISKKHLTVNVTVPETLMMKGDEFLLHQALANLVRNAVDFSPEGGAVQVAAEAGGVGDTTRFTITDEGPGIPHFAKDKIFDKFFSLQRPDTGKKSTGLGLNFVRQVALLHGGVVRLENRDGPGAVAVLEVPVDQA